MFETYHKATMKILVVEDDPGIASLISRALESDGYQVSVEHRGDTGLDRAKSEAFDLIILDVMLPGKNGFEFAQEFRWSKRLTPILMLTARDEIKDRVKGLDAGADDYLPKPFDVSELLARTRAQLRRDKSNRVRLIRVADLEIDTVKHVVVRAGKNIVLTKREFDLLVALASNEGRVLTRDIILNSVWPNNEALSNTIEVYVAFLRKKIDGPYQKKLIHTVRSLGYCLEDQDRPLDS